METALTIANVALLVAGMLACGGVALWLARFGRWRNPLADVPALVGGPTVVGVALAALACFGLPQLVTAWLGRERLAAAAPGTSLWHQIVLAQQALEVLAIMLMVVLLTRTSSAAPVGRRLRPLRCAGLCAVAWLAFLPVGALQLEMGRIVWRWLYPDMPPPVHDVLRALAQSQWGLWGTVQLVVGAVVIAPFVEELFFRGLLLGAIHSHLRRAWLAITASAVAFAVVHAQPQDVLPLFTMGVLLGYLRLRCGVLWPCVLFHAVFNMRTVALVILAPELLQEA